jgi:beta-xylosidase
MSYGDVDIRDPHTQIPLCARPTLDIWMRDPQVCVGRDGEYYLTGTTRPARPTAPGAHCWSDGIRLWRSPDLRTWEDLGLVWDMDRDGTWQRHFRVHWPEGASIVSPEDFRAHTPPPSVRVHRACWAPEIHYLRSRDNYVLVGSVSYNMGVPDEERIAGDIFGGTYLLVSKSGEPTGPYEEPAGAPLTDLIDANLIEEEDGTLYLLVLNRHVARLRDDLKGLAEAPQRMRELRYSPDARQVAQYAAMGDIPKVEETLFDPEPMSEGGFLFKALGRYHLCLSMCPRVDGPTATYCHKGPLGADNRGPYDVVVASSDNIRGPYGPRYTALTHGGHGNFFADREGRWWGCVFNPPRGTDACFVDPKDKEMREPWRCLSFSCQPVFIPMKWEGGRILPDHERAERFYGDHS